MKTHRHGIVLARPLLRASFLAAAGGSAFLLPWPVPVVGAVLLAAAALAALAAVVRWNSTRLEITDDRLVVAGGVLRRRTAAVRLDRVGAVEVEQSLLGRLLGYGTLVAGDLEVGCVPRVRDVQAFVERHVG